MAVACKTRQRSDQPGPGAQCRGWREVEVACCQRLSSLVHAVDPQPEPPAKFLKPFEVARLAAEIQSRGRCGHPTRRRRLRSRAAARRRTRRSDRARRSWFGRWLRAWPQVRSSRWQMAADGCNGRGLDQVDAKGIRVRRPEVQLSLFELHLLPLGVCRHFGCAAPARVLVWGGPSGRGKRVRRSVGGVRAGGCGGRGRGRWRS